MTVPPAWIHLPKDIDVLNGDLVTINCKASGKPTPTVTWTRTTGNTKFMTILLK